MSLTLTRTGPNSYRLRSGYMTDVCGSPRVIAEYWKACGGRVSEVMMAIRALKTGEQTTAYFGIKGLFLFTGDERISA